MSVSEDMKTEAKEEQPLQEQPQLDCSPRQSVSEGPIRVPGHMQLTVENFRDTALDILSEEMKAWHGPAQYLRHMFATPEDKSDFKRALDQNFPADPVLTYQVDSKLPDNTHDTVRLHLWDLGFESGSSSKTAPLLTTSLLLLDEYLTNGIVTDKDPLQLLQGQPPASGEHCFWTVFVKGAARSCTALFLAAQCIARGWNLSALNPTLQRSMCALAGRRAIMSTDAQSAALENARLSTRGAIRRQHCCLTWLGTLSILQSQGLSPEQILKAWNTQCTQKGQVVGQKRTALLAVLKLSDDCQKVLLEHLSEFGDNTAFLEDTWGLPKFKVGSKPRSAAKIWNDRLTVTSAGQHLMLRYVHRQHQKKLPGTHTKLTKDTVEECLSMALLLRSAASEVTSQTPIAPEIVEEEARQCFCCSFFVCICLSIKICF